MGREFISGTHDSSENENSGADVPSYAFKTDDSDILRATDLLARYQQMITTAHDGSAAEPHAGLPKQIGKYRILRMLGSGGCGVVYHGVDDTLNRDVAVKIPMPFRVTAPIVKAKFLQEAQSVALLDHPNIVTIFEAGEDANSPYIAYAYCAGPTLAVLLRENGPCHPDLAAAILVRLAGAVQFSHDNGILHRDIKPANVLLFPDILPQEDGLPFIPRLTDFGLATLMEATARDTHSSTIVGSPMYMAPETLESPRKPIGPASDVFGLGAVLFESITGRAPFQGETIVDVLDKIRAGSIPSIRLLVPKVRRDLEMICSKALAIVPEDRYTSPAEFKLDLIRYLRNERVKAKPRGLATQLNRQGRSLSRLGEAVGYVIVSHTALMLWIVYWPVCIFFKIGNTHSLRLQDSLPSAWPLLLVHVISIYLGWKMGQRRTWAAVTLTCFGAMLAALQLAILGRWVSPPFPTVYSNPIARDIVFSLVLCLFAMQAILCGLAWRALLYHSTRTYFRH